VSKASGCEGGYHFHAFEWVIENGGIATEVDYPYRAENGTCKSNKVSECDYHFLPFDKLC